eukprot:12918024-Prorocentrum_lima.AAC.1
MTAQRTHNPPIKAEAPPQAASKSPKTSGQESHPQAARKKPLKTSEQEDQPCTQCKECDSRFSA